jgi:CheY-like chemotaxis protein
MPRILAIEPDGGRRVTLQRLVREHLRADVVLTASADDALASLADATPDVILTSSLLPEREDEQLTAHLRAAPDLDHLQVLTIPPLVEIPTEKKPERRRWFQLFRARQQRAPQPAYDFSAISTRIEEALEQSKYDAPDSEIERPARLVLLSTRRTLLLEAGKPQQVGFAPNMSIVRYGDEIPDDDRKWRSRARRWNGDELPWLSHIQLAWGASTFPTLRLLNISSTGLLLESSALLTQGNKAGFRLAGSDHEQLIVHASVVRADPLMEDRSVTKYIVAATFDWPFSSLGPVRSLRDLRRSDRIA